MLWLFLIGFSVFLGLAYAYLWNKITMDKPASYPTVEVRQHLDSSKKTIVCFGDSLTHGNVSYNWVTDLEALFPDKQVLNAGANSDLTYTLLHRIDDVIDSQPAYVIVLVGTNDLNATLNSQSLNSYRQMGRISKETSPDFESFKANYKQIIQLLKQKTSAKIAVVSLPVYGEDLLHPANKKADNYSLYINELAQEEGLTYLPFREKEKEFLFANPQPLRHKQEETLRLFALSLINHFILGRDWDYISKKHGFQLTTDNLHLNSVSGAMLRELVKSFISAEEQGV